MAQLQWGERLLKPYAKAWFVWSRTVSWRKYPSISRPSFAASDDILCRLMLVERESPRMETDAFSNAFIKESIQWMHSVRTCVIDPSHEDLEWEEQKILDKVGVHAGLAIAFQDLRNHIEKPLPADSGIHKVVKLGNDLCRPQRGEKPESTRQRAVNLMLPLCAAKWGLENIQHLEGRSKSLSPAARLGTETMEKILSCAKEYEWNDMKIILNHVLVERNKVVARGENNRVKGLREVKGQFVLASEWVEIIKYKRIDLRNWEQENDLWCRNRDGSVMVGNSTLKGICGDDYPKFLLDYDSYGLIRPWDYKNGEGATLTLLGSTASSAPRLEDGPEPIGVLLPASQDPRASTQPPTQMPTPNTAGSRNTLPCTLGTEGSALDYDTESSSDEGPSTPGDSTGAITLAPNTPEAWQMVPPSNRSSASTAASGLFLSADPKDKVSFGGDGAAALPVVFALSESTSSSPSPSPSLSPYLSSPGSDSAPLHLEALDDSIAHETMNHLCVSLCLDLRDSSFWKYLSLHHGRSPLTKDEHIALVMGWTWEDRDSSRCEARAAWSQCALNSRKMGSLVFDSDEFREREEKLQPFPDGIFRLRNSPNTTASDKPFDLYMERLDTLPQTQLKVHRVFSHVAVSESESLEVAKFVPLLLEDSEPILTTLWALSDPRPRWLRNKLLDQLLVNQEGRMFSKACSDVAENLCSGFLGTTGAFSGARLDVLCDTVIDVQSGSLLAVTLPMDGTESSWTDDGSWIPTSDTHCTVTIVEQASQLYIPAGHIYALCALERSCWISRLTFNTKTIVSSIIRLGRLAEARLVVDSYLNSYVRDWLPSIAGRLKNKIERNTENFSCSSSDCENAVHVLERYSSACDNRPHKRPRV